MIRELARRFRRDVALARPEARRLCPIAAGGHVAPAPAPVPRRVVENPRASPIGAPPDAKQLTTDQRFGGRLDDRDHEPGERVTDRHEALVERSIVAELHAAVSRAASQHAIDLGERVGTRLLEDGASFGQRPQRRAHATRIDQRRGGSGRLLLGAAADAARPFGVEHTRGAEPLNERVEVAEHIDAHAAPQVVGVDEVQPQSLADEDEGRWRDDHLASAHPRQPARRGGPLAPSIRVELALRQASRFGMVMTTRVTDARGYIPKR